MKKPMHRVTKWLICDNSDANLGGSLTLKSLYNTYEELKRRLHHIEWGYYLSFLKKVGFQLVGRISRVLVEKERRQSPGRRVA